MARSMTMADEDEIPRYAQDDKQGKSQILRYAQDDSDRQPIGINRSQEVRQEAGWSVGASGGWMCGEGFMVARHVPNAPSTVVFQHSLLRRRATIKALPTPLSRPRPLQLFLSFS